MAMRLLCAGGGSGGHVTPVVVVINELALKYPDVEVVFVCDKAFAAQSRGLMKTAHVPITVKTITAGKLRRYKHLSVMRQLLMPKLVFANVADSVKVLIGFFQSLVLIWRFKPDIVFAKGGFVCLPVGMAARLFGVPIVVHDSDTRPGLTNSVLGRWASAIATGSPTENYRYRREITRYSGVPIDRSFRPYTPQEQQAAKRHLGFDESLPLVVVTGGGLGATRINTALLQDAEYLVHEGICLYHVTGRAHYEEVKTLAIQDPHYQVVPFVFEGMADILGAADVVVSRASATFIQELAGMRKTAILIPAKTLGDQRKNAEVYREASAAVILSDDDIEGQGKLADVIMQLVRNKDYADRLAETLHSYAKPHAASDVAAMIAETYRQRHP
ncbi:MAG: UDP-N-acetylglucosamine--N-acetylmuramyl-(pentapeptide) pyrophosphoryl-undecaprenol N-acetylglucosamine transferase [Candidatus Saccharimonas aalborgensis]